VEGKGAYLYALPVKLKCDGGEKRKKEILNTKKMVTEQKKDNGQS